MSVLEDIKSAWKKIAYVFSKEYKEKVNQYVFLEKNGIEPELHINVFSENEPKSQHQKYVESLRPEQSNSEDVEGEEYFDEEYRELLKKTQLHPLMPRKYNAVRRTELREFERELLTGSKDKNVKPTINGER